MIVMKFGGTSNQDAAAMNNVISIVQSHLSEQPVVVISAIARATNDLEQAARTAAQGNAKDAKGILSILLGRHNTIARQLVTARPAVEELKNAFTQYHLELNQLVDGVAILKELTPRTMDAFCSYGERLSSRIVAAGLQRDGIGAVWIDAREFMITDDNFGRAQPLMDIVTSKLENIVRPLLDQNKVPVTQGFIGVTQSGVYTTMGRESSDYSASIIGAAMNAAKVQIWTDVDGILTADPSMVAETKKVKSMSFEEAFELSYFGAKVLHPGTMLPVIEKKIPVQILNSKRKDGSGTLIDVDASNVQGDAVVVKSIAYKKNLSVITLVPHKRLNQYLFWEQIFSVLNRYGVSTGMVATSEYSISFAIDSKVLVDSLTHELQEFGIVEVFPGKGSICLVGKGMRARTSLMNRLFDALAPANVAMISYGASPMNCTVVIDEDQIPKVLNALHKEFFETIDASDVFEPRG